MTDQELLAKIERGEMALDLNPVSVEPFWKEQTDRVLELAKIGKEVLNMKELAEQNGPDGVAKIMDVIINLALTVKEEHP